MVNLRGALRGFGVGLTQVGQMQYQEQQREAEDRRVRDRMAAMAALEQRIRNEDADTASKRELLQAGERDNQALDRLTRELPVREKHEISTEERAEDRQVRQENRAAAREAEEPIDSFTDEEGYRVFVYRDGSERRSQSRVRDSGTSSESRVVDRYTREDGRRVIVFEDGSERVLEGSVRESGSDDLGEDEENVVTIEDDGSVYGRVTPGSAASPRVVDNRRSQSERREPLRTRQGAPVRVRTVEEARRLPSGTRFITPDGQIRVRQ